MSGGVVIDFKNRFIFFFCHRKKLNI
jgi:hypothetical protein